MQDYQIAVYDDAGDEQTLGALLKAVATAWPDTAHRPVFERRPFSALTGSGDSPAQPGIAIVMQRAAGDSDLYKLIDRMRTDSIAGLVLVSGPDADTAQSSGGVLVRSSEAPASCLASSLHALCSYEEVTTELRRELRISQKTSGGVREEMSRISQELSLASKIQQELVPRAMPAVNGMDFGVLYRPAGYVSGDIYNIAMIDDRRLAFFIADAVGHGVPAALLTMIISRSLPMRGGLLDGRLITPSDALGQLNDELCNVSDGNPRFATAVYGIMDTVSGMVRIANGGHPQPMRISGDRVEKVEAGGPLLGVFHEAEFDEEVFELSPGETLLLYSDGFETAFPDADAVLKGGSPSPSRGYIDHLLSVGRRCTRSGQTVSGAFESLEERLDAARGSLHQVDDVTALALERIAA